MLRNIPERTVREIWIGLKFWGKPFAGTCITLAALWGTDHLAELPKYTNYAYPIAIVVIIVGILGRKRRWATRYRKTVFDVDSWLLYGIALLILSISAEKQLTVFEGSGLSLFNLGVGVFLVLGIWLPTPIFMLADWMKRTPYRIQTRLQSQRVPTIFDTPGATLLHPRIKKELVMELIHRLAE